MPFVRVVHQVTTADCQPTADGGVVLEFTGKQLNVVDYKTGKYENAKKKLQPPNDNEPNGGDYWRQAVFYKILIDNDKSSNWQAISTAFEFIEPVHDEYKVEKIMVMQLLIRAAVYLLARHPVE